MGQVFIMEAKKLPITQSQMTIKCFEILPQNFAISVAELNRQAKENITEEISELTADSLTKKLDYRKPSLYFAIAFDVDDIVGFCYGCAERKLYEIYDISVLYVKPEYRQKNIGKDLMITLQNHVLELPESNKLEYFKAITQPENLIAIKMLESIGYHKPRTIEEHQLASAL